MIALIAAIALAQEASGPPPNLPSDVISSPLVWERPPKPAFPGVAGSRGIQSGWATIRCQVDAERRPNQCEVLAESAEGMGFGEAAVEGMQGSVLRLDWALGRERDDSFNQVVRFMLAE